jgi:hypothetical protein
LNQTDFFQAWVGLRLHTLGMGFNKLMKKSGLSPTHLYSKHSSLESKAASRKWSDLKVLLSPFFWNEKESKLL